MAQPVSRRQSWFDLRKKMRSATCTSSTREVASFLRVQGVLVMEWSSKLLKELGRAVDVSV